MFCWPGILSSGRGRKRVTAVWRETRGIQAFTAAGFASVIRRAALLAHPDVYQLFLFGRSIDQIVGGIIPSRFLCRPVDTIVLVR